MEKEPRLYVCHNLADLNSNLPVPDPTCHRKQGDKHRTPQSGSSSILRSSRYHTATRNRRELLFKLRAILELVHLKISTMITTAWRLIQPSILYQHYEDKQSLRNVKISFSQPRLTDNFKENIGSSIYTLVHQQTWFDSVEHQVEMSIYDTVKDH